MNHKKNNRQTEMRLGNGTAGLGSYVYMLFMRNTRIKGRMTLYSNVKLLQLKIRTWGYYTKLWEDERQSDTSIPFLECRFGFQMLCFQPSFLLLHPCRLWKTWACKSLPSLCETGMEPLLMALAWPTLDWPFGEVSANEISLTLSCSYLSAL